ncbi:MAG TPA: hypothetical protein VFJ17_14725 [Mycobacteriales bacterium]|nr:hypothetical protein [Mycobacteriales bacterium]
MNWGAGVVLIAFLAFVLGLPLWLMLTAPRRGLGRERPRHPFRIPQSIGWFLPTGLPGFGDTDPQDTLEIPPVEESPEVSETVRKPQRPHRRRK